MTMPLVWIRAGAMDSGMIGGFRAGDIVLYYLCMLLLSCFITSHIMWEVATEIKEGQFSTALMRPISFYQFTFLRNLSWRVIRMGLFAPIFLAMLFFYHGYLTDVHLNLSWEFWTSVVLGHLVSFNFVIMMAMIALFVQEVYSIFELYYVPMLFLSGQLFPVSMLPDWARSLAQLFPFYYTTGAPTEILVGRVSGDESLRVLVVQGVWIAVTYALSRVFWSRGLKYYTGVGM
jgi:ABC-2 type transport system permease protein